MLLIIRRENWQGTPVYIVENEYLSVSLCPSLGNNLYRLWDKTEHREVLRVPDAPQTLRENPGKYGTPLMMPPNRIRHGSFEYGGRRYQMSINTPDGHHIHGFLRNHPWEVIETKQSGDLLSITSVFDTRAFPDVMEQYPHQLRIEMTYTIRGSSLIQNVWVKNLSQTPAPFGYGVHTWFLLDNEPEKWTIKVPVSNIWELNGDLMPTGRLQPLGALADITQGLKLGGKNLDTVFQIGNNPCEAILSKSGCDIHYSGTGPFKQWVIYTEGVAEEIICLEPYTWVTNAPNLDLNPDITGLRAIGPAETLKMEIVLDITYKN